MRLAVVLVIFFLSGHAPALAVTDVTDVPFASDAQACIDQPPSASNDPNGFLQCTDLIEVASIDRWHARYVAEHPATKACRDNPPPPSDPSLTSLCFILIDQEATAVAHYKDKMHVNMGLLRTRVLEHAGKKAARKTERLNVPLGGELEEYNERLDWEIAQRDAESSMRLSTASPPMREPITCTSSRVDNNTNTDCY